MAPLALIFGALLSVLGVVLFALADPEKTRITSLIPTFFGVALILMGILAQNEKMRMHAMHVAALLALIGLVVPLVMVIRALVGGAELGLASTGQLIMAALCGVFLILCVRSFIAARRARRQNMGA